MTEPTPRSPPDRGRWVWTIAWLGAVVAAWTVTRSRFGEPELWRAYSVVGAAAALVVTYAAGWALYYLNGRGEPRRRLFRAVLTTMALGAVLVLLELPVVFSSVDYQDVLGTRHKDTWLRLSIDANARDPELIHLHWPHTGYEGALFGNLVDLGVPDAEPYPVDVRYDHRGFRNDTDLERADVVAIGDSFVEAAIIPLEETVTKQLERRLGAPVANLGQAAYGLRQEFVVLRRYGLPLRPRVVLWFLFGGNDLRDVPIYDWMVRHYDSLDDPAPRRQRLFTRNVLHALSDATVPRLTEPTPTALSVSGLFTCADGTRERVYFGCCNGPWTPRAWDVATSTLAEARDLSREAGAHFVTVYITRKFRVYRDHVSVPPGSKAAGWTVNDLPTALATWCGENDIPFLDLSPLMEAEIARGTHPYLRDDVHWNARGHEIAADAVAALLEELGWKERQE